MNLVKRMVIFFIGKSSNFYYIEKTETNTWELENMMREEKQMDNNVNQNGGTWIFRMFVLCRCQSKRIIII